MRKFLLACGFLTLGATSAMAQAPTGGLQFPAVGTATVVTGTDLFAVYQGSSPAKQATLAVLGSYMAGTFLSKASNLSDVASVPTSRINLGLGIAQVPTFSNVLLTSLAGSGVRCVHVDNTGLPSVAAADCGSGSGGIAGPGTTTDNYVPQWNGTVGTALRAGLPTGTTGNSVLLQTRAGGDIDPAVLPGSVTPAATSHTISATTEWAIWQILTVTTAAQTFTLPAASTLSAGGGVIIQTPTDLQATLTPNALDGINGGPVNIPVILPAGGTWFVSRSAASGTGAISVPLGPYQYYALTWAEGTNLSAAPRSLGRLKTQRTVYGITCTVYTAAGTAGSFDIYSVASGTDPATGGTKLNTNPCNTNTASLNEFDMVPNGNPILPGYRVWMRATGTGLLSNGEVTITFR